ncbi:MAG TPA: hypothetical protein VD862_04740 [Candidatus Paceibacterota bacterium]|nr:hypothetical protein [Candidatus Paceibacterota bacterium]
MRTAFFVAISFLLPAIARAQSFKLTNPLGGNAQDVGDLIDLVAQNLLRVAIPIAILMYIYAGIRFIVSRGNPAGTTQAKNIMWYTSIGLAIILIGGGFVDLIQSILNLG